LIGCASAASGIRAAACRSTCSGRPASHRSAWSCRSWACRPIAADSFQPINAWAASCRAANAARDGPLQLTLVVVAVLAGGASKASAQQPDAAALSKNQSEAEELELALRANSAHALRAYLQKYPQTNRRLELLTTIAQLRRGEFTEWTVYE